MDINYNKIKTLRRGETGLVYIYVLLDPLTNMVRYVCKTDNIQKRLNEHIRKASYCKTYKDKWINKLILHNQKPLIEVVDEVSKKDWSFWEKYWIDQIKTWGFKLTNIAAGGGGGNLGEIVNRKISESKFGYKHTDETKQKISNFRIGKKHTEETIVKFKENKMGNKNPMFGKKRSESSKNIKK